MVPIRLLWKIEVRIFEHQETRPMVDWRERQVYLRFMSLVVQKFWWSELVVILHYNIYQ